MKNNKKWFTLVELIVVVVIIWILSTVSFYNYVSYIWDSRDAERISDMANLKSSLKLYKSKRWKYPIPWEYFNITNSWFVVANQGFIDNNVVLSTIDKIPYDKLTNLPYFYSTTTNNQEFQIAMTLENEDMNISLLDWDYKSVSKNILPNIILALKSSPWQSIEINKDVLSWSINRNYFIFNKEKTIPYSFDSPYNPKYDNTILDDKLLIENLDFWQNSDYMSCDEIFEDGKAISSSFTWEYQILSGSALTNTWCLF